MNGFTVRIKFTEASPYSGKEQTLHNITEIHSNYPSFLKGEKESGRIAFESDIDTTGYTYDLADIKEYEATAA